MNAIDYALSVAPEDVAQTIRWLEGEGFVLCRSLGGPGDSFGDVLLDFEWAGTRVTVVRDRSQWMVDIAPPGDAKERSLVVLLSAMRGDTAVQHSTPTARLSALPDQLPEGETWRTAVPAVVAWLMAEDRAPEIAKAERLWRVAMKKYFRSSHRPKHT
jgi:hypothetical protein